MTLAGVDLHSRKMRASLLFLAVLLALAAAHFTVPASSFASDSLMKVLQARGWIESGFRSQEIHYPAKAIDPDFSFFPIGTIETMGEHLGPFPFANTILTAPFAAAGSPEALIYFCALLFCAYLCIFYGLTQRYSTLIAAALGTPLFHHFTGFSDVAAAALLSLCSVFLIYGKDRFFSNVNPGRVLAAGALMGLACWFRQEVVILLVCFTLSFAVLELVKDRTGPEWKQFFRFQAGFAAVLGLFIGYNLLRYHSILGPRVDANQAILSLDIAAKVNNIRELLFGGGGRVGFLSFSPWYALVVLACLALWSRISETSKILAVTFVAHLVLVCILTPNNSNIDWGTRYFSCSVFIPILLLDNLISINNRKIWFRILLGTFAALVLYSGSVNQRAIKSMRKSSLQLAWIQSEIPWDSSRVFVTKNVEISNAFGLNYLSQKILLVRSDADLDRILANQAVQSIVLIEHAAQPSLSNHARKQGRGWIISEKKAANMLLILTELTRTQ